MILTFNRDFVEWGESFGDSVVATVLLDRLLRHAVMIQIEGSSYRLRQLADLVPKTSSRNLSSGRRRHQSVAAVHKESNHKKRKRLITGSPLTVSKEKLNAHKYTNFGAH
jgi:IstB-like ATP binding protein